MFTISEGFTTGISRYTPNKYQLLNNTVVDATIAEYAGKSTTNNTQDASLECTRKECDVFVRKEQDGATTFYKTTNLPYEIDTYQDQNVSKEKIDVIFKKNKESVASKSNEYELVPAVNTHKSQDDTRNIIIIIVFIGLIVIIIHLSASNKGSVLYEHRPMMADESGVLV
tara:strand:+ start:11797 stop:12306 length:510 start_codon:yes stop_codon:yes gene_type:complete